MDTGDVIECPECRGKFPGWEQCVTCEGTGQVTITLTPGPKRPA